MFTEKINILLRQVSLIDILRDTQKVVHRGGSQYLVQCPFHSGGTENNPSMSVDDDKGLYKCFTCGEEGNILKYLRIKSGLSFKDSVAYLGRRFSIDVSDFFSASVSKKDFIYKESKRINKIAMNFYGKNLLKKDENGYKNTVAISYLKSRQIPFEIIKNFKIGYAPKYWDLLTKTLQSQGVKNGSLIALGLGKTKNGNNVYDSFINRIIFPIIDENGDVIGFGGRSIDNIEPKYLNSKESLVFKKKYTLYGINLAKNAIMKADSVILVEGYMDVVAMHKMSVCNTVGTLGTACTEYHIKKLMKYTKNIVFAFDNDAAGARATEAAVKVALKNGVNPTVLLPYGVKDFDEYFTDNGIDSFNILYENRCTWYDYLINNMLSSDDGSLEYKITFLQKMFTYLTLIDSNVVIDEVLANISKKLQVDRTSLVSDYEKYKSGFAIDRNLSDRDRDRDRVDKTKASEYTEEKELIYLLIINPKFVSFCDETLSMDDFNGNMAKEIYVKLLLLNKEGLTTDDICFDLNNKNIREKVDVIRNMEMYTENVEEKIILAASKMRERAAKINKDGASVKLKIQSLLDENGNIDELCSVVSELQARSKTEGFG